MYNSEILITGGEGFIGSHLRKSISGKSYDLKSGKDIFDSQTLERNLKGKKTVIHLAALVSASESIKRRNEYLRVNAEGTEKVIKCAIQNNCKNFILASSAAIYNPDNPYGLSKLMAEKVVVKYKNKIKVIILRFYNVYGDGQNPAYAGVITKFIERSKGGKNLVIYGDGKQTRDFVWVGDISLIILRLLKKLRKIPSGTIIEIGTGKSININELANFFSKKFNIKIMYRKKAFFGILHSRSKMTMFRKYFKNYKFKDLETVLNKMLK